MAWRPSLGATIARRRGAGPIACATARQSARWIFGSESITMLIARNTPQRAAMASAPIHRTDAATATATASATHAPIRLRA